MATLPVIIDASKARTGASEAAAALNSVKAAAAGVDGQIDQANNKLSIMGRVTRSVTGTLQQFGATIGAAFALRSVLGLLSQFEETMYQVKSVSGATDEQLKQLTETARKFGATTRFSATEAGQGLLELTRAGFTARQAMEALPGTLNLAIAGQLGLGRATEITANTIAQFGLRAAEATRVADVLALAANASATDVGDLAEGLKYVGSVAGSIGKPLEEVAAAMGVLANNGLKGTLGGTALRGIISDLIGPSELAKKAIADMGLKLEDLNPAVFSLTEIFGRFAAAGLNAKTAFDIFGERGASAALILRNSVSALGEMTNKMNEAGGTAARIANDIDKSLVGSLKGLASAAEEAALYLGDAGLTSGFKLLVDLASDVLRVMTGTAETFKSNEAVARTLAAAIQVLATATAAWLALNVGLTVQGWIASLIAAVGALTALTASEAESTAATTVLTTSIVGATIATTAHTAAVYNAAAAYTALLPAANTMRLLTAEVTALAVATRGGVSGALALSGAHSAMAATNIVVASTSRTVTAATVQLTTVQTLSATASYYAATAAGVLSGAFRILTATFRVLTASIAANPIGAVAVAIGLALTAVSLLRQNLEPVTDGMAAYNNVINQLRPAIESATDAQNELNKALAVGDSASAEGAINKQIRALNDFKTKLGEINGSVLATGLLDPKDSKSGTVDDAVKRLGLDAEKRAIQLRVDIAPKGGAAFSRLVTKDVFEQDSLSNSIDRKIADLEKQRKSLNVDNEFGASTKPDRTAQGRAAGSLADLTRDLAFESTLLGKTNAERERAIQLRKVEAAALAAGLGNHQQVVEVIGAEITALQQRQATAAYEKTLQGLQQELTLLSVVKSQRAEEVAVLKARQAALEAGLVLTQKQEQAVRDLVKAQKKQGFAEEYKATLDSIKQENDLLKLGNRERDIASQILRIKRQAEEAGSSLTRDQVADLRKQLILQDELKQQAENINPSLETSQSVEISTRFTGISAEFKSQRTPLVNIESNTRRVAEAVERAERRNAVNTLGGFPGGTSTESVI